MNARNWSLYKESQAGQNTIAMFDMEVENWGDNIAPLFELSKSKGNFGEVEQMSFLTFIFMLNLTGKNMLPEDEKTREMFEDFIRNLDINDIDEQNELTDEVILPKGQFRRLNSLMHILSTALYSAIDPFFKPLLYQSRFDIIQSNCDKLGIELPDMPHTKDYSAYMMYYYDMCVAFQAFQNEHHLTDAEFCACLYDYAETLGDDVAEAAELPRPTNIWFVGASKADMEAYQAGLLDEDKQIWQCNERTRRGDIIVLYALSPYSCIHSIWRAKSGGFFNPFDLYQTRTTICDCHELEHPVSISELRAHPYFFNLPIVRKNLQGINGVELSATDYQELLSFFAQKGCDTSVLPHLLEVTDWQKPVIEGHFPEKQVEEKILIPVLEQLGYTATDWSRQLEQKAGRGLKAIPDFVFFPQGELHMHNAPLVIEAKYDMSSSREYDKAFRQCLSYARLLRSKLMGICDEDRLVIYKVTDLGSADKTHPVFEAQWAVIHTDVAMFNALQKLIGRTVIAG